MKWVRFTAKLEERIMQLPWCIYILRKCRFVGIHFVCRQHWSNFSHST